jgi:hypothetical protein
MPRVVLLDARLTRDAYRDMYKEALVAGLGTSRRYREAFVDGGSTVVEFRSGGARRVTTFQVDDEIRTRLIRRLVDRLHRLPRVNGDGLAGPAKRLRYERIALVVERPKGPTAYQESPWPLRPLAQGERAYCMTVTGREAVTAVTIRGPSGSARWSSGGHAYELTFRPLLSDEHCGDVLDR